MTTLLATRVSYPHCDARILHRDCDYCNKYPEWQALRIAWGINFTGEDDEDKLPCPADKARGDNHMKWHGNVPMIDGQVAIPFPSQESISEAVEGIKKAIGEI